MLRLLLLAVSILIFTDGSAQFRITDMPEPTMSFAHAMFEGYVTKDNATSTDSIRIYVFDLIQKDGHAQYAVLDSAGHFKFDIHSGTTCAVAFYHGKTHEGILLVEPGETTSLTLDERKSYDGGRWRFGGAHSEWNNDMNRLPSNARFNSLYNEISANWNTYTEDEDEFRFKEEVVGKQAELEQRIKSADVMEEVKTYNLLGARLYFMELLSGYAMTLNQKYLQRGIDRSVSRDFYREAVRNDFTHHNALLYTPLGSHLRQTVTICNEQRGAHFTLPSFLDKIDFAQKGMRLINEKKNLNDKQLAAIKKRCPDLFPLIQERDSLLREQKRDALRNPMYYIRYIDEDVKGKEVYHAIMDQYGGRIVVVDFWATWCMPCRMAMENMKPLKEAYKDSIAFVYVTGETSSEDTWRGLIPDIRGDHFYLTDAQWKDLCKHIKVKSIPAYLVVDWDGLISKQFSGFPGNESLEKEIVKLLDEKRALKEKEKQEKAAEQSVESDGSGHDGN